MNRVILIGRTTKEIELKTTQSGKAVTRFTIAVNRNVNETDFIPCVAWEHTAELLNRFVRKGDRIAVSGSLITGQYEKDGQTRTYTEVRAERIEMLESKRNAEENELTEVYTDDGLPF